MMYKLSILICTLTNRNDTFFAHVNTQLSDQVKRYKNVEILYIGDNKARSVGRKRNDLLKLAQGEYVCFVDDDDIIADDFIDQLLKGIGTKADCINYVVECSLDGGIALPVFYSIKYNEDKNIPGKMYLRLPNHLMCVKRNIATKVMFKEINCGEDSDYAIRLKKHIRTEHHINKTLYYYNFNSLTTETQ